MNVLWIALVWPEPGSSAAGVRTMQLLRTLKSSGCTVQVVSPCRSNQHRDKLISEGFLTESFKPNDSEFDLYLKQLNPDVVFFDRFIAEEQFGWRVREQCPDAVRILDTVDLHFLRQVREKVARENGNVFDIPADEFHSEEAIREIASIYRSDLTLIISDFEVELLYSQFGVPLNLLSLCRMSSSSFPGVSRSFEARRDFITIGNFNHPPNLDSYLLLHNGLWNRIRSKLQEQGERGCELHIYGAYPRKEFMELDDPETGFRVKGWADDLADTMGRYRINLAPLSFGAGIKGKVLDGWVAGTPCIATSVAAEGMHGSLEFGGVVEDNWERYAEQAALLYLDSARWCDASIAGTKTVETLFSSERNDSEFLSSIELAVRSKQERRRQNFIGSILWHHGQRSTEFFSRWIETKNKLKTQCLTTSRH